MTKAERESVRLDAFADEQAGEGALDAVNTLAAEADRLEAERDAASALARLRAQERDEALVLANRRLKDYRLADETAQIDRALARRDADRLRAEIAALKAQLAGVELDRPDTLDEIARRMGGKPHA